MTESFFLRIENTVDKGENASNHHFLLFLNCFLRDSSKGSIYHGIVGQRVKNAAYK